MELDIGTALKIKRFRIMRGYMQKELAAKAGVSREALNRVENGKQEAGTKILHDIAIALEVKISDLL